MTPNLSDTRTHTHTKVIVGMAIRCGRSRWPRCLRPTAHERFYRCDNRSSDLRRWRIFMRGRALDGQSHRTSTDFSYGMDCKDIALAFALLLRKRNVKKRKKFWVHPITRQRLFKGKFSSLYEDLKAHPITFF
jgi:hypothetical protein